MLVLLETIGDSTTVEIIGRQFNCHPIAGKNLDVVHAHLAGDMRQDLVPIFQLDLEHCVGERFDNRSLKLYCILFCH